MMEFQCQFCWAWCPEDELNVHIQYKVVLCNHCNDRMVVLSLRECLDGIVTSGRKER